MKKIIYIAIGLLGLTITGCKKNPIVQISNPASGAQIKFFHAAPGVPALDAFVNGTQITPSATISVTDNALAASIYTGYTYLSAFPGSNYAVIAAGNNTIKVVASTPLPALVSAQTVAPGTTVTSASQAMANGSAYTVFTAGLPGSATTPLTSIIVQDMFPAATTGNAYIRLAHLIPNGGAVDLTGTYTPIGGTATPVTPITNIVYGTVTPFVAVPVNSLSTTSYVFQSYLTGTTTKLGTTTTFSLTPGRYYTVILRGLAADYPVPGTSITLKATARPTLPVSDPTIHFPEIYFNVPGLSFYTNK
jgi:hypothetical protein